MTIARRSLRVAGLALGALLGLPGLPCHAQFTPAGGFSDAFSNNAGSGMLAPRVPSQGGWAEVITATPKWLVLQNQEGQQYPVSFSEVQMFLMRWPTTLDRIAPGSLVEAYGLDLGTNQVSTDSLNVYEGTANVLGVMPSFQTIVGFNRVLTAFDIDQHNTYGVDYFRFLMPEEMNMPRRMHVIGPIMQLDPLQLGVGGGIVIGVIPAGGPFFITSITPGSSSFVRKGDLVYYVPTEATPKSLNLAELVVYKKIPQSQFVP